MSGPRMRPASDLMYSRRMPAGKFRITAKTAGSVTALSAMGFSFRASMKGMCGRKMSSMGVPRPEELEEGEQVLDDVGGWTGTAQRGRRPHNGPTTSRHSSASLRTRRMPSSEPWLCPRSECGVYVSAAA